MPKDYFLNARYLFGFLAPGTLWIASASLLLGSDPFQALRSMNFASGIALLAAGFVVGHVIAPWSFGFGIRLSRGLEWLVDSVRRRNSPSLDEQKERAIVDHARALLVSRCQNKEYVEALPDADFTKLCKRILLQANARVAQEIDELEAEINLRTGFAAPLLFAGLIWASPAGAGTANVLPGLAIVAMALGLVRQVEPMRRHERRAWCKMVLASCIAREISPEPRIHGAV